MSQNSLLQGLRDLVQAKSAEGAVIRGATYIVENVEPGYVFVYADVENWSDRIRRISGQDSYHDEDLCKRVAKRGAVAVLSSRELDECPLPVFLVEDSRRAFWELGKEFRAGHNGQVVGITGTVGKSTVTSLVSHLLSDNVSSVATRGNWNTIDGVAGAVSQLAQEPEVGVFEAAISGFGRFADCSSGEILKPTLAVLTSTGAAHLDVAPSLYETAVIKSRIFEDLAPGGTAIINADSHYANYVGQLAQQAGAGKVIFVGRSPLAHYRLLDWAPDLEGSSITASLQGQEVSYRLSNPSGGIALSSLFGLAVAVELGLDLSAALQKIPEFRAGRRVTEISTGKLENQEVILIDDSKNATDLSYRAAVDLAIALAKRTHGRVLIAAGQILYLGDDAERIHGQIGEYMKLSGVREVFTYGEGMEQMRQKMGGRASAPHADSPEALAEQVVKKVRPNDVVLVKGSHRGTGMRKVAPLITREITRKQKRFEKEGNKSKVEKESASGVKTRLRLSLNKIRQSLLK